jgi:hypothetical protein
MVIDREGADNLQRHAGCVGHGADAITRVDTLALADCL